MTKAFFQVFVLKLLLALVVLILSAKTTHIGAQIDPSLDSLQSIIYNNSETESNRISAFDEIIEIYENQGNDSIVNHYLNNLKIFSDTQGSELGNLKHLQITGNREDQKANYNEALNLFNLALPLAKNLKELNIESQILSSIAKIYARRAQFDTARVLSHQAIQIGQSTHDLKSITIGLTTLGNTEQMSGNFMKALGHYLIIDSIFQNSNFHNSNIYGIILINMGLIYNGLLDDVGKAKKYLSAAIDLNPKVSDRLYYSTLGRLGNLYVKEKNYEKADSLLETAINGLKKLDIGRDLAISSMYYAESKIKQEEYTIGLLLLEEVKEKFESLKDHSGLRLVNRRLANYYFIKEEFAKSEEHLKEVFKYSTYAPKVAILKELADVSAKQGKFKIAYDTLIAHIEILDSLYKTEFQADMSELEKKFQTAQKERQIVELALSKKTAESKNQKLVFWGAISLFTLLGALLFYFYRSRQISIRNNSLTEFGQLRSKLFSDISHEFRTPLSLISGPLEIIARKVDDVSSIDQELNIVRRNASKLNHLVDSVQNLSKLDAGKLVLQIRPGLLNEHLRIIGASFESMAVVKNLSFNVSLDLPVQKYYYDPDHLETILYNLLSNAIKFSSEGEVRLEAKEYKGRSIISVSDNGVGFNKEEQKRIFERYHRIESQSESVDGVGIGLALTYELTKLHFGTIEVESKVQQGSKFTVTIPTTEEFYKSKDLQIGSQYIPLSMGNGNYSNSLIKEGIIDIKGDHPYLLIVEDNQDMAMFLESLFKNDYSVLKTKNGKEGFEKSIEIIPDIIISDLMMPIMDGQALLKAVKTDPRTSHIPFIMLTANHMEEAKLSGLEHRVDDYLTKPFSTDEIQLKVKNHILLRQQLKSKYQSSSDEGIHEYQSINETEQKFWNQLNEIVQKNIGNAQFSADDFSKALYMSRMQLHRKLKALTGLSTTRYMRNERLKIAHKMICTNDLSITNVAYEVGFTSPSFFSQSFKEKYGVTPNSIAHSNYRT